LTLLCYSIPAESCAERKTDLRKPDMSDSTCSRAPIPLFWLLPATSRHATLCMHVGSASTAKQERTDHAGLWITSAIPRHHVFVGCCGRKALLVVRISHAC
jgi:hypothetical protein